MSDANNQNIFPEEEENTIILTDEDGNEVSFELLDIVKYEGDDYAVLLPDDDGDDEEGGIVILKILGGDDEDTEVLEPADDEAANAVFEIFKDEFKDEFSFED